MFCAKCNHAISLEYGQTKCPHCGAEIGHDISTKMDNTGLKPPSSEPYFRDTSIPQSPLNQLWDNNCPFFTRLFNTWKKSTFYPVTFFKSIPTDAGLSRPLLYAIITMFIGVTSGIFWNLLFTALQIPFFGMDKKSLEAIPFLQEFMTYIMIGYVILSPIFTAIWMFIFSGILHLCLMILGSNKKGFEATFRSVAYGISPNIFAIVPFCGGMVGGIWGIVTTIIGLKQTHQIPTWKAIVAYFLPMIFCCICVSVAAIVAAIAIPNLLTTHH
ncbi:MAG: YIP1 family protein [Planctomycetota bacterium]